MKAEAIVYESNTGFTKKYAELLAQAVGIGAYERRSAGKGLKKGAAVLYMGWLMAGNVKGFRKARRRYSVKGLAAVGMGSPSDKSALDVASKYTSEDMPVFYLPGGLSPEKLRGLYRIMMNNVAKATEESLGKKDEKTEDELRMLDLVKNGGDFVKKENLEPIISWIK